MAICEILAIDIMIRMRWLVSWETDQAVLVIIPYVRPSLSYNGSSLSPTMPFLGGLGEDEDFLKCCRLRVS